MQILKDYRLEGQRRDIGIIALIQRHGVLTSDLIQLALSREQFDLPGQSPIALLKRLAILAERGYIHRLGRSRTGHIVYASHPRRRGARPQIEHDLIGARFGVHLDVALVEHGMAITDLVSTRQELEILARQQEWHFVPDRTFMLKDARYFCEFDNSTEGDDKVLSKVEAYRSYFRREKQRKELMEKLGEKVNTFIRVLWICPTERRAEKFVGMIEGNLHWVVSETAYIDNPAAILMPIWKISKNNELSNLIK